MKHIETASNSVCHKSADVAVTTTRSPHKSSQLVADGRRTMWRDSVASNPHSVAALNSEISFAVTFAHEAARSMKKSLRLDWVVVDGTRYFRDENRQRVSRAKACCVWYAPTGHTEGEAKGMISAHTISATSLQASAGELGGQVA